MSDLIFLIKCIVMTAVVVLFMQVKVGSSTLEEKTMWFVSASPLVQPLQKVADGAVLVVRDVWRTFTGNIHTNFSNSVTPKNQPGQRSIMPAIERSRSYLQRKAEEAARRIREKDQKSSQEKGF